MFQKIKNDIRDFWSTYRIELRMTDQTERDGWRLRVHIFMLPISVFCWSAYHHWIARLIYKVRGHAWECDDYATPDSGYMGAHCDRCGWSFGTYLY